jgi:hypothetical protein
LEVLLAEVENFCLNYYLVCLAKGAALPDYTRKELIEKMKSYTGLSADFIERRNYRINWIDFTKNLLKNKNQFKYTVSHMWLGKQRANLSILAKETIVRFIGDLKGRDEPRSTDHRRRICRPVISQMRYL